MLKPGHYDGTLYDNPKYREAPTPAVFVDRAAVTDVEVSRYGQAFRANFSMDWRAAYDKVVPLLRSISGGMDHAA